MDSIRAKQIWKSSVTTEVLYQGSPVWIENINSNNTVEVTNMETKEKIEVPAYLLIENTPARM
jgi:H-type small acid-soluble spore protein